MGGFSKNAVTAGGAPKNVPVLSSDKRLLLSNQCHTEFIFLSTYSCFNKIKNDLHKNNLTI
jgi:hypothetical protein